MSIEHTRKSLGRRIAEALSTRDDVEDWDTELDGTGALVYSVTLVHGGRRRFTPGGCAIWLGIDR